MCIRDRYHPHCIVLNRGTVIGENCILRQGATIGSLTDSEGREGASPVIGNNVEFGAHVVVIGPVTLGDNVKIGAGTVVTKDLAAGQVVVGQPFRVLHTCLLYTSYTMPTFKMLAYRWKNGFLWAPGELLRNCWGKAHFPAALRIVRNELIFTLYLLVLLICLLTFNGKVIAIALLPLLAFIALKAIKNKSLRDGVPRL